MSPLPLQRAPHQQPAEADEPCFVAFQREIDHIYRTLRRFGAKPSELDDLAQEVFLALRHSWPRYDTARPLRPYLFGITFRVASAHLRDRRREVLVSVPEEADVGPRPDDALQTKQARTLVLAALEQIPLRRRAVLVMHELDEVPVREIASILEIPRFTVYSRLRVARRELKAAFQRLLKRGEER